MLIPCIHVPAPQTSTQQTHGLVGLRPRRLCPDTHVEPGPGATGKLPVEKSTCVCVPLRAHGGGWSRAWSDRGALEATALITATAWVLRGGRNTEKVTSWLVGLGGVVAAKMWVRLDLGELHADNFGKLEDGAFPFFCEAFRG